MALVKIWFEILASQANSRPSPRETYPCQAVTRAVDIVFTNYFPLKGTRSPPGVVQAGQRHSTLARGAEYSAVSS